MAKWNYHQTRGLNLREQMLRAKTLDEIKHILFCAKSYSRIKRYSFNRLNRLAQIRLKQLKGLL